MTPAKKIQRLFWRLFFSMLVMVSAHAENSFTNVLSEGERFQARGEVAEALKLFSSAEPLATNSSDWCVLARRYCDLMHDATENLQKNLAQRALAAGARAVATDSNSATAHLTLAVCYAKNFPYADNQTKVNWSKAIKTQCETALALDPKQDVGYYLLGRWNFDVANMNFLIKGVVKLVYGGLPRASNAEAIKNFKAAIALKPERIIHHLELAKVYAATGERILARTELDRCIALKPVDRDDAEAQTTAGKLRAEAR